MLAKGRYLVYLASFGAAPPFVWDATIMGPERIPWDGGLYSLEPVENSKGNNSALCGNLNDLVPFETMCYLRSSPRVLDFVPMVKDVVRDYVTLASICLNELSSDPKMAAAFDTLHRVAVKADSATGWPPMLPSMLQSLRAVRASCHRRQFASWTLWVSLPISTFGTSVIKDLRPLVSFPRQEFPHGFLTEFNRNRILMLRVLAFEQNGRATTKVESDEAENMNPVRKIQ
jgi:hypothetical protein